MELKINDVIIPLNPGTQFQLVRRSPLFATSESKIPGSYIFNTNLPGSEILKHVFGQAHRPQRGGRATAELPAAITDGSMRLSGTVTLVEADRDSYDASFVIDNGDLAAKLKEKTLKDLDLGEDITIITAFSASHKSTYVYKSIIYWEIELFFTAIDIDVSSSLTENGHVFTAPVDGAYEHTLYTDSVITAGAMRFEIYKNDVLIFNLPFGSGIHKYTQTHNLLQGDEIRVRIYCLSAQYQIDINVKQIRHEFTTNDCIFDTIASLNQDTSDYAIFPIANPKFLDNFPDDAFMLDNLSIKTVYSQFHTILNYYRDNHFPVIISGEKEGELISCANLFTPFLYMKTLLCKIINDAGFTIVNNPFDGEFSGMVLFNAYAENIFNTGSTQLTPFKPTFNLINHVPEMLQSDLLNYVCCLTGFMPIVDNNLHTITFVDLKDRHVISAQNLAEPFPGKILKDPIVTVKPEYAGIKLELKKASVDSYLSGAIKDLHDKLIYKGSVTSINLLPASGNMVNDMYLVTNLNEYYVFQYNPETYTLTWRFYSKKFPIVYTEGTEPYLELSTELCPVLTTRIMDETLGAPANRIWIVPRCDQAGTLEGFPDSLGAEYGLQVLFYKGLSLDSLGDPYPLGTCRYDDYTGNPLQFPDLSASSLFENRFKSWLQWIAYQAKPVTLKSLLTAGELSRIKYDQIYSAYGYNFLVKEIRVSLRNDGLSVAVVDIYTV